MGLFCLISYKAIIAIPTNLVIVAHNTDKILICHAVISILLY